MIELKVFFIISLCILVILFELKRFRTTKFDIFSYFLVYFFLMYLIPVFLWILTPEKIVWTGFRFGFESGTSWLVLLTLFLAYVSVYTGFKISVPYKNNEKIKIEIRSYKRRIYILSFFSLFILFFLFLSIYTSGGLINFLQIGILSRSGEVSLGLAGYLRYFFVGTDLLSILWLGMILEEKNRILPKIYFLLIFLGSFIVAISTGSRGALIYPIISIFIFVYGISSKKIEIKSLLLFFVLVIFAAYAVSEGRLMLYNFAYETDIILLEEISFTDKLLTIPAYFKHYLITINQFYSNPEVYEAPRFWIDYPRALLDVMPGFGWTDGSLDVFGYTSTIFQLNKDYLYGNGYVPPGWIGSALINASVFGLVLQGFMAGYVGGRLNSYLFSKNLNVHRFYKFALALFLMTLWYQIFFAQDPWQVFIPNFGLYLLLFVTLQTFRIVKIR